MSDKKTVIVNGSVAGDWCTLGRSLSEEAAQTANRKTLRRTNVVHDVLYLAQACQVIGEALTVAGAVLAGRW